MKTNLFVFITLLVIVFIYSQPLKLSAQEFKQHDDFITSYARRLIQEINTANKLKQALIKNPTQQNLDKYNEAAKNIKQMKTELPKIQKAVQEAKTANSVWDQCKKAVNDTYVEPISSLFIASQDQLFGPNWQSINSMYALIHKKQQELIKKKQALLLRPHTQEEVDKLQAEINDLKEKYESLRIMTRLEQRNLPESTFFWSTDNPMTRRLSAVVENFDYVGYTTNFIFGNYKRWFDIAKPYFYSMIGESYPNLTHRIADSIVLPALTAGPSNLGTALENTADKSTVSLNELLSKYALEAAEKNKEITIKLAQENQEFILQQTLKESLKKVPVEDLPRVPVNLMADTAEAELRHQIFQNKKLNQKVAQELEEKHARIMVQITKNANQATDDSWLKLIGKGASHANKAGYIVDFGQDFIFFLCTYPEVKVSLQNADKLALQIRLKYRKLVEEGKIDKYEITEDECLNMTWFKEGTCFPDEKKKETEDDQKDKTDADKTKDDKSKNKNPQSTPGSSEDDILKKLLLEKAKLLKEAREVEKKINKYRDKSILIEKDLLKEWDTWRTLGYSGLSPHQNKLSDEEFRKSYPKLYEARQNEKHFRDCLKAFRGGDGKGEEKADCSQKVNAMISKLSMPDQEFKRSFPNVTGPFSIEVYLQKKRAELEEIKKKLHLFDIDFPPGCFPIKNTPTKLPGDKDEPPATPPKEKSDKQISATIAGLNSTEIFGTSKKISLSLTTDKNDGPVTIVWNSSPNLIFNPEKASSSNPDTTVTFDRMSNPTRIWAEITVPGEKTVESNQLEVEVVSPKYELIFDPPAAQAKLKQPVKVTIKATPPPVDAKLIDYRWVEPDPGKRKEISPTSIEIIPATTEPIKLHAIARVPGVGDTVNDEIKGQFSATSLDVTAKVLGPKYDTPTMVWDPKNGIVKETKQFAIHQDILVQASVEGTEKDKVLYLWSVNEDSHIVAGLRSDVVTINRSQTGTCVAHVTVSDKDGNKLGKGEVSFDVPISQEDMDKAREQENAKLAKEKLIESKKDYNSSKIDEAIEKAEEAIKLDPKNTEASSFLNRVKSEKERYLSIANTAKDFINKDQLDSARSQCAQIPSNFLQYPPIKEIFDMISQKELDKTNVRNKLPQDQSVAIGLANECKYDEAISMTEDIIKRDPFKGTSKEYSDAKIWLEQFKKNKATMEDLIEKTKTSIAQGDYKSAYQTAFSANSINKNCPGVPEMLAIAEKNKNQAAPVQSNSANQVTQNQNSANPFVPAGPGPVQTVPVIPIDPGYNQTASVPIAPVTPQTSQVPIVPIAPQSYQQPGYYTPPVQQQGYYPPQNNTGAVQQQSNINSEFDSVMNQVKTNQSTYNQKRNVNIAGAPQSSQYPPGLQVTEDQFDTSFNSGNSGQTSMADRVKHLSQQTQGTSTSSPCTTPCNTSGGNYSGQILATPGNSPCTTPCNTSQGNASSPAIIGTWRINANNYPGTLEISSSGGSLTARVNYDITSKWETLADVSYNSSTGEISFRRPWSGNPTFQIYSGRVSGSSISGTFKDNNNPNATYSWSASK